MSHIVAGAADEKADAQPLNEEGAAAAGGQQQARGRPSRMRRTTIRMAGAEISLSEADDDETFELDTRRPRRKKLRAGYEHSVPVHALDLLDTELCIQCDPLPLYVRSVNLQFDVYEYYAYCSGERSGGGGGGAFDITPHPSEEHDYSSLVALPNVHPVVPGYRGRGRPPLHLKRQHWGARGARVPATTSAYRKRDPLSRTPRGGVPVPPGTIVGTLSSPSATASADGVSPLALAADANAKPAGAEEATATAVRGVRLAPLSSVLPLLGLMRKKRGRKPKDPSRLAARLLHDALIGRFSLAFLSSECVFLSELRCICISIQCCT